MHFYSSFSFPEKTIVHTRLARGLRVQDSGVIILSTSQRSRWLWVLWTQGIVRPGMLWAKGWDVGKYPTRGTHLSLPLAPRVKKVQPGMISSPCFFSGLWFKDQLMLQSACEFIRGFIGFIILSASSLSQRHTSR